MKDERDLTAGIEAAWKRFRSRLADHLSAMDDDDILCVEIQTGDEDERDGAVPYVQFCAYGHDRVHVEAASNWYLDDAYLLAAEGEDRLVELGWERPREDENGNPEEGWANFWCDAERREADRVAAVTVATLREVYAAVHPAFLDAAGLEIDPAAPAPEPEEPADRPALSLVEFPSSPDELQELVGRRLSPTCSGRTTFATTRTATSRFARASRSCSSGCCGTGRPCRSSPTWSSTYATPSGCRPSSGSSTPATRSRRSSRGTPGSRSST